MAKSNAVSNTTSLYLILAEWVIIGSSAIKCNRLIFFEDAGCRRTKQIRELCRGDGSFRCRRKVYRVVTAKCAPINVSFAMRNSCCVYCSPSNWICFRVCWFSLSRQLVTLVLSVLSALARWIVHKRSGTECLRNRTHVLGFVSSVRLSGVYPTICTCVFFSSIFAQGFGQLPLLREHLESLVYLHNPTPILTIWQQFGGKIIYLIKSFRATAAIWCLCVHIKLRHHLLLSRRPICVPNTGDNGLWQRVSIN